MYITRRFNPNIIFRLRKRYIKPIWFNTKRYISDETNKINESEKTKCTNCDQVLCEQKINQIKANLHLENAQNLNNSSDGYITLGGILFFPMGIFISPLAFVGTALCMIEAGSLIEKSENLIKDAIKLTDKTKK